MTYRKPLARGGGVGGRYSSAGNRWVAELFVGMADLNYDVRILQKDVPILPDL